MQCSTSRDAKPPAAAPPVAQRSGSRLTRLLSWRSNAQPAAVETAAKAAAAAEIAEDQQEQQQIVAAERQLLEQAAAAERQLAEQASSPPGAAAEQQQQLAAQRPGAFSLYSWLTWSSTPAATSTDSGAEGEAAELGDGMAAAPQRPQAAGASGWRRSWYSLSRSSVSSYDEAEPAQQDIPVRVDHPALQLLRTRALAGSRPGSRRDPFKLGLVVEGGGMRGCVSGGALQALSDLGLRDVFDAVYGSSAGAINSTYFISGQRTGVHIYHDHIASPDFINLKRLWKGENAAPVLDLSFLIDHVMHSVHPLDWDAVLRSPLPLKVVASSLDSLTPVVLERFSDKDDLAESLKASATVPEIAGGPRLHRGQRLVDAAVFEPVPFRSAIADGCTHLLVLCTRPKRARQSRVNLALTDAMEVAIKKAVLSPDYMVPAWKAEVDYLMKDGLSQDDMLLRAASEEAAHELPYFAGTHVYPLYPGAAANFSPLCIDPPTLKAGVAEGRRGVLAVCRAVLGDALDFSRFAELERSNIVPHRSSRSSSERLWRRYMQEDFSHHA